MVERGRMVGDGGGGEGHVSFRAYFFHGRIVGVGTNILARTEHTADIILLGAQNYLMRDQH